MFDVIATAKNTQWLTFPTLSSKCTHSHVCDEAADFQTIPGKNCFIEFNKKFGFELLRTVSHDGKDTFQRIKKRHINDISCGAIAKVSGSQIAIGLTTGFVRLFDVKRAEYLPFKFRPDCLGNSVVGLDYSCTDEYLSVLYESFDIALFELKSGIKTEVFRLPGMSTLIRSHPTRMSALAVGSYEGSITILDVQTKKKLFFNKMAHDDPIRDISMYESSSDVFVSCGFDCNINVFDLRIQSIVQQYKQSHPMSTVSVSPCGTFCVAGNLKGDIISYDFRAMKQPLDTKRLYDSAVVRVAFIPNVAGTISNGSIFECTVKTNASLDTTSTTTSRPSSCRDSFSSFVEKSHCHAIAMIETPKRRDSWADLMSMKKVHDFSMDSMAGETSSRMSIGINNTPSQSRLSIPPSRYSIDFTDQANSMQAQETQKPKSCAKKEKPVIETKRRRLTQTAPMEEIKEEDTTEVEHRKEINNKKWLHTINHKDFADKFAAYVQIIYHTDSEGNNAIDEEDKENCQNNQQNMKSTSVASAELSMDTPKRHTRNVSSNNNGLLSAQMVSEILREKMSQFELEIEKRMNNYQKHVMASVKTTLQELTSQVRYMQGRYFHSDFNYRYRNHMEIENQLEIVEETLACLLRRTTVFEQKEQYAAEYDNLNRKYQNKQ